MQILASMQAYNNTIMQIDRFTGGVRQHVYAYLSVCLCGCTKVAASQAQLLHRNRISLRILVKLQNFLNAPRISYDVITEDEEIQFWQV